MNLHPLFFYDFACSANEYALNREPAFFKNTRFFHDIFHSYNHKCASTYHSSRITSLKNVDSEICEQFNAFVGRMKFVCSHLSQSHFCFLIQLIGMTVRTRGWRKKLKGLAWQTNDNNLLPIAIFMYNIFTSWLV